MKILVPVKCVIDPWAQVRLNRDKTAVDVHGVKMTMNPFDEIALEEGVRLREQGEADDLMAVSIGGHACVEVLKMALAKGADRALHVETDTALLPIDIANILHRVALDQQPDLILMGKQASDDDCHQVAEMLAAKLSWPQACHAATLQLSEGGLSVDCETDFGMETRRMSLPALVTADLRLNQPRHPTIPNIVKARQKPLQNMPLSEFNIALRERQRVHTVALADPSRSGRVVDDFESVLELIRQQGQCL